ncbi:MAG TPA: hypothetical protein VKX49_14380 [Bryobacteraceae bacterium]|nr:hypothetical protein [Bryobacteraceae bacterium]
MVKKVLFGFASVALTVASAANTYNVKFWDPVTINGAKLQPGDYRVEVNGSTAVIKNGKKLAEVPVKVENVDEKYRTNTLRMDGDRVAEIRIGGTHTKLVFEPATESTK